MHIVMAFGQLPPTLKQLACRTVGNRNEEGRQTGRLGLGDWDWETGTGRLRLGDWEAAACCLLPAACCSVRREEAGWRV